MKTNAAEYFSSLSPLKAEGQSPGSNLYEAHVQNGRSGRCHCCPYGYHIDLDFVRYCERLAQGSKNDNPTLRHLKKLKRARRRQTKSMEVLLGISSGNENETQEQQQPHTKLEIIEEPLKFDSLSRDASSLARRSQSLRERTPPPPPPRRCTTPIMSGPPPDVINTTNSSPALNTSSTVDASEALQEAVMDFEEMLENTREKHNFKNRSETLPPNIPSLDLLHHTPPLQTHHVSPKVGVGVSRSHSLPRQWLNRSFSPLSCPASSLPSPTHHPYGPLGADEGSTQMAVLRVLRRGWSRTTPGDPKSRHTMEGSFPDDPALPRRHQRTNSTSSLSSMSSASGYPGVVSSVEPTPPVSTAAEGASITNGLGPPDVGMIQQHMPLHLSETLAVLNAARGYSATQPDFDTMSVTSAMSGVSTTTLQSIRDQMATSLCRLKELEEEVKTIPMLQIKLNVLKEEKKLLLQQLKLVRRDDVPILLPPSLEGDLTDLSEEELEGRLARLRNVGVSAPQVPRKRSESPMRVNLEEFRSYRRARRGSVSEGSETESVRSVIEDTTLFIKETQDHVAARQPTQDTSKETLESHSQDHSVEKRLIPTLPSTPVVVQKNTRDASTSCRVLTRDIGVSHVGNRTRSVGLTTDKVETDRRKEIKAKPCMQCYERNRKTYESKSIGTSSVSHLEKLSRLNISNVSLESVEPDINSENKDQLEKEGSSKNTFLQKLGRKSAIISRLSEPQLAPPVLTFDNSTNTETAQRREQLMNTNLTMSDLYTEAEMNEYLAEAKKEWEQKREMQDRLASINQLCKPLLVDRGNQVVIDDPLLTRTKFQPLLQNVGVMVKPSSVDVGVGDSKITDNICEKCENVKTRSVGSGDGTTTSLLCDKCAYTKTRSFAVGDYRLTDNWCEKCSTVETRSVASSNDKICDRICDRCDNLRTRSVAIGTIPVVDKISEPTKPKKVTTVSTYVQTKRPETRATGINTLPLNLKKEELNLETTASPPSPALTPEVERRSFGSSGVRICDKCHETIQSVAKDIVNTSGTASATNLPPLPPQVSKIPRLVDLTKIEPRLELPKQDFKTSTNLPTSLGSSLSELQTSSLHSSFIETKPSSLIAPSSMHAGSVHVKPAKFEQTSSPHSSFIETKPSSLIAPSSTHAGSVHVKPAKFEQTSSPHSSFIETKPSSLIAPSSSHAGSVHVKPAKFEQTSSPHSSFIETKPSSLIAPSSTHTGSVHVKPAKFEQTSSPHSSLTETKPSSSIASSSTHVGNVQVKPAKFEQSSTASESSTARYSDSSRITTESSKITSGATGNQETNTVGSLLTAVTTENQSIKQEPPAVTVTSAGSLKTSSTLPSFSTSTQGKRVPYNRQQTFTKFSEGLVNLGFDETADAEKAKIERETKEADLTKAIPKITENNNNLVVKKVEKVEEQKEDVEEQKEDVEEQKEDVEVEETRQPITEPEPVIQSKEESQGHTRSSSESETETCDEESLMGASFSSQLDDHAVPSSFQSASSLFTVTSEKSRKKAAPTREMKAALKVLNDSIGKPVRSGQQLTNALNIIQREWFKMSSQNDADPHAVEDYMDIFEEYSKGLLQRVVNLSDVNGNTAMHYAVSHGNFDVVSVLLDSKVCNVNHQNKAGYTATMLVSLAQIRSDTHASVVQRLFQLGDVNIKASQHGQTALMLAVSHGRLDMVRMLVSAGAEINIQDEDGSTALMCAAEHGHLAIVKFLLSQPDTDPTLMDNVEGCIFVLEY